jgi:hypothetical protein
MANGIIWVLKRRLISLATAAPLRSQYKVGSSSGSFGELENELFSAMLGALLSALCFSSLSRFHPRKLRTHLKRERGLLNTPSSPADKAAEKRRGVAVTLS